MSGKYIYNFRRHNSVGQSLYKTQFEAMQRADKDLTSGAASPMSIEVLGRGVVVEYGKDSLILSGSMIVGF